MNLVRCATTATTSHQPMTGSLPMALEVLG